MASYGARRGDHHDDYWLRHCKLIYHARRTRHNSSGAFRLRFVTSEPSAPTLVFWGGDVFPLVVFSFNKELPFLEISKA